MKPVLRAAEAAGDLRIEEVDRGPFRQQRVVSLRDPDMSYFSPDEIALVDESLEFLKGMTATELSDHFHQFLGWQAADIGQVIPYQTIFFYKRMPTKEEADYALTLEGVA